MMGPWLEQWSQASGQTSKTGERSGSLLGGTGTLRHHQKGNYSRTLGRIETDSLTVSSMHSAGYSRKLDQ